MLYSSPVLIAETDPAAREALSSLLSVQLPHIETELCTRVEEAADRFRRSRYCAIVTAAPLLQSKDHRLAESKQKLQPLTPLVVTAGAEDKQAAQEALEAEAFDLIAKPIDAHEAIKTIRLALWQGALLRLLTSKATTEANLRQHIDAFPDDLRTAEAYRETVRAIDRTYTAVTRSLDLIEKSEGGLGYEVAGVVEMQAKRLALDRLFRMPSLGSLH